MSNISVEISSLGAFSHHWNKCIENNDLCFIRFVKSARVFFKALFWGYTVYENSVDKSFLLDDGIYKNSIFGKEYRKKLNSISVKKVNDKVDNKVISNNPWGEKLLKNKKDDLTKLGEEVWDETLLTKMKELINAKDYHVFYGELTKENIDLLGRKGCCLLFKHARNLEQYDVVQCLLLTGKFDEPAHLLSNAGENMLFFFVHHNMLLGLEYLLKNSLVDINEKNYNGHTALIVAVKECKIESIKFLLKNGAKMNAKIETVSLLCRVIINGNLECLKALLNNDGVMGNIDDFLVLINCATMNGNKEPLRMLLMLLIDGENININKLSSDTGLSPLYCAAMCGNIDCLNLLLLIGADVNLPNKKGLTPLHIAAYNGHEECVDVLVNVDDIQINVKTNDGDTALHYASNVGAKKCIERLLSHPNIQFNLTNAFGMTALSLASMKGYFTCVEVFLGKDNIQVKGCNGGPLHDAIQCRHSLAYLKNAPNLGKLRALVNDKNDGGDAPLHLAVTMKNEKLLNELLDVPEIDVNNVNYYGDTPLHLAITAGSIRLCKALLSSVKIDLNKKTRNGLTPIGLAERVRFSWYISTMKSDYQEK